VTDVSADLQAGANPHRFSANRSYRKDGAVIHCEWYNSSLLDGAGKLRSILSLVLDVTKRKEAEDRLRQWNQGLENRVQERTAALAQVARRLEEENAQRREAQRQLEAYQRNLQAMAHQVLVAEERERHRLALDLHDGLGQTLTLAKMKLTELRRDAGPTPLAVAFQEVVKLIDEARRATSTLTFELSPPILHELGLVPAVRWLAEDLAKRYGLAVEVEDDTQPKPLAEQVMVLLFRATRELLINVAKHAQTKQARVSLSCRDGQVRITVEDRGAGFDAAHHADIARDRTGGGEESRLEKVESRAAEPSGGGDAEVSRFERVESRAAGKSGGGTGGFGLFSLRERLNYLGGRMEVHSVRGQGTTITLLAPLDQRPK
jgi:signal transduction histidine kinase